MLELFANAAQTTLAGNGGSISSGATTLLVSSSVGFPAAATGVSQFRVLCEAELMTVTNVASTTWTVTRGVEGTTAATHIDGRAITHVLTAGAIGNLPPVPFTFVVATTNYTAKNYEIVQVDATSGNIVITVPSVVGTYVIVKRTDGTANTVTLAASVGGLDGGFEYLTASFQAFTCIGTGSGVFVIAERKPFGFPAALGPAANSGALDRQSRSDHIHDTTALQFVPWVPVASMGSSHTLDLAGVAAKVFDCTLDSATCAVSVTGFPSTTYDGSAIINFHQDLTGGRKITWADTIVWVNGYPPVIAQSPSAVTTVTIYSGDNGTTKYGSHSQKTRIHRFINSGALTAGTGKLRLYFENDSRIVKVRMSVGDAPVTTAAIVDIDLDSGTNNLYTTQANRPSVAAAGHTNASIALPDVVDILAGHYITVDIDQASSAGFMVLDITTVEVA